MHKRLVAAVIAASVLPPMAATAKTKNDEKAAAASRAAWTPLFNGKDLSGWTPKIKGEPLGEDRLRTFRVKEGRLVVSYDQYARFDGKFGHLAYAKPLSKSGYRLRAEYRFVGQQAPGGPEWALRNSGFMIFGQPPETMGKDQDFPVSIEVQLLGGAETGERQTGERPTGNVCSPGTNYLRDGKLVTEHCVRSSSKTFRGDQWVTIEIEVHGNRLIKHVVDGETVFTYGEPQLDLRDANAKQVLATDAYKNGGKAALDGGHLYVQAESHPIEFRKIEMMQLGR